MKKLSILLIVFVAACNTPAPNITAPNVTPHVIVKDSVAENNRASFMFMGTESIYATADAAMAQMQINRPFYATVGIIAVGDTLCNSQSTTNAFDGKGGWIAISNDYGKSFKAVKVGSDGIIQIIQ